MNPVNPEECVCRWFVAFALGCCCCGSYRMRSGTAHIGAVLAVALAFLSWVVELVMICARSFLSNPPRQERVANTITPFMRGLRSTGPIVLDKH